jgi:multidrug resistance efflux pump
VAPTASNPPELGNLLTPTGNGSPNGSPSSSRPPKLKGWSRRTKLLIAVGAVLFLSAGGLGAYEWLHSARGASRADLVLHKVKYDRLELTVIERGALESSKNSDIYCRVKAGSKNATIAAQIKWLLDDGSEVKGDRPLEEVKTIYTWDEPAGTWTSRRGPNPDGAIVVELKHKDGRTYYADLLVDLDESGLQEQLKTEKITLDKDESDKIQAEEAYKITASQNDSDIKSAETKLELATIDLMKYTGLGRDEVLKPETFARLKEELKRASANARRPATELAEEDVKKYKSGDYLGQLKDLLGQIENAKSDLSQQEDREAWSYRMVKKGYQTSSQAQSETSRKESFELTLNKLMLNLDVLVKYTKTSDLTKYLTNNPTAGGNGGFEEMQRALERTLSQAKSKEVQARIDRETKKSVWEQQVVHYNEIKAEIKKCKVYAPQDGMVVYYIPDQARWGGGSQQSIVAQGEPVREGQKMMQIPDLKQMLANTKVHEALVSRIHAGQKATVRVDSFSERLLHAEVESVATVASQQDWMAADVKVYATKVAIHPEDLEGIQLKPGMSAEVTITVADALEHVLTVPVQAVIGGSEMGSERRILVMTPDGPKEKTIIIGASNEKVAEVRDGLQEGDEVVLNPKVVLGDKIKVHQPSESKGLSIPDKAEGKSGENGAKNGTQDKSKPAAKPAAGAGGGNYTEMTPEQREKMWQQTVEKFKKATPEKRKEMIGEMPEAFRDKVKEGLKAQGVDIPD